MKYDLHSHTLYSDGSLPVQELLSRAIENGVDALSITDHDNVDCYNDPEIKSNKIRLIPGIEFSTTWSGMGVHVLGLDIDPFNEPLLKGIKRQKQARADRARKIDEILQSKGIEGALAGARDLSQGNYLGRPHFARYLVDTGKVADMSAAFKRYLGAGKPCDVKQHWAQMSEVIAWIRQAGGIAVLAHPLKYKLTASRLKRLIEAFIETGGQGMEVISGRQLRQYTSEMARLSIHYGLLASAGSDFHQPGTPWSDLGAIAELPARVTPVWDRFSGRVFQSGS